MKLNKSTLKQMIKEEMTKLVELERLKRLQARDKMKKLEAQLAAVKKAQAEADRGMDDPAGMGGAAYMDTDYRDSLKKQEAAIAAEIKKLKDSGEDNEEKKEPKTQYRRESPYSAYGSDVGPDDDYYDHPGRGYIGESKKKIKSTLKQLIREEIAAMQEVTMDDVAGALLDKEPPEALGKQAARGKVRRGKLPDYHEELLNRSADYKKAYKSEIKRLRGN